MDKDMQITLKNLQKVYDELPKLAEKYPGIKEKFNMCIFGVFYDQHESTKKIHVCGTAGCLLGNSALVLRKSKNDYINSRFSYSKFSKRVFPLLDSDSDSCFSLWHFLFSMSWKYYQPSFEEALQRVKYFLDCEGGIGKWKFQKKTFIYKQQ